MKNTVILFPFRYLVFPRHYYVILTYFCKIFYVFRFYNFLLQLQLQLFYSFIYSRKCLLTLIIVFQDCFRSKSRWISPGGWNIITIHMWWVSIVAGWLLHMPFWAINWIQISSMRYNGKTHNWRVAKKYFLLLLFPTRIFVAWYSDVIWRHVYYSNVTSRHLTFFF